MGDGISDITGATVTLGGYTAYQVYGYYKNEDIMLVSWYFKVGDNINYVAIEGSKDKISGLVEMVEKSYSVKQK